MKTAGWALLVVLCLLVAVLHATGAPKGKLTVRVLGEDANPVEGADVIMDFTRANSGDFGNVHFEVRGKSDAAGSFTAAERTGDTIAFAVKKAGFYRSSGSYTFQKFSGGRWKPDNPVVDVTLRKIGNPVPMLAKEVSIKIPECNRDVGFDFMVGDWTAPFGAGVSADMLFYLERDWKSRDDFGATLTMKFPNKGDGVQAAEINLDSGSDFKLPRMAPESGYASQTKEFIRRKPGHAVEESYTMNDSSLFRIRTVFDESGKIRSALFGKIRGPFRIDPSTHPTATIFFIYYLNPDGSNNIEFDPRRNLFTNLDESEKVTHP